MIDVKILRKLYKEDIIYHYTKASTAIDFILYENKLRFNKAQESIDPIESSKSKRLISYNIDDDTTRKDKVKRANKLLDNIVSIENRFNQICFCKNNIGKESKYENVINSFIGNEELFGFTKLRMWDQYADEFKGVCIAFSKKKILTLNESKLKIEPDDIKYRTFQELLNEKIGDIEVDSVQNIDENEYEKKVIESFFYKHKDYSGENEYRIGLLSDEENSFVNKFREDKYLALDISCCVEAIFVSSYANEKQKKDLLEYTDSHNIELFEIIWSHNHLGMRNYGMIL